MKSVLFWMVHLLVLVLAIAGFALPVQADSWLMQGVQAANSSN
jgi:hypothetical protein